MLTALSFGFWLSALNVRYRDVNYLTPFLIQIWMYLTPVIYSATLIPERYRFLLALNPMTAVVEGFRWCLLGPNLSEAQAPGLVLLVSILITIVVLISERSISAGPSAPLPILSDHDSYSDVSIYQS